MEDLGHSNESDDESSPEAGRFDEPGRRAAASRAVPWLATYFADAPTWELSAQPQVATTDARLADLAALVRMRVALAAGAPLEKVLQRIVANASFRYSRQSDVSVGAVRGRLDVPRYIRERSRAEAPRRYPIEAVQRRYSTDENGLAAFAALWVRRELALAPLQVLPSGAPEKRAALGLRMRLGRLLREPVLREGIPIAERTWRRSALHSLVDATVTRLESGRIAASDAYTALVDWVGRFAPQEAAASAGTMEWAFYDDRFDTKLFEIFCLAMLSEALKERLGEPDGGIKPLYQRFALPICAWHLGATKVRLFFQASLQRLALGSPVWQFADGGSGFLGGFPDIAIVVDGAAGQERITVLVDPKLRIRPGAPSEEIYKLIGYFGNLPGEKPARGAIVFYAPQSPRWYRLTGGRGGEILALGVDPGVVADYETQFRVLADLVVRATSLSEATLGRLRAASHASSDEQGEMVTASRQEAAVEAMAAAVRGLPPASLEPTRKITEANLHDIWDHLSPTTQTMLVTAEYFGQQAPRDADHSGPLLGLAAASERVLYEDLFEELARTNPQIFPPAQTFGTLLHWLTDACRGRHTEQGRALFAHLRARHDIRSVESLLDALWRLNNEYRIPAAHRDIVPVSLWVKGHAHILTGPAAVLPRLVRVLGGSSAELPAPS